MTIDKLIQHLIDVVTAYESDTLLVETPTCRHVTSEDVDAARSAIRAEFERMQTELGHERNEKLTVSEADGSMIAHLRARIAQLEKDLEDMRQSREMYLNLYKGFCFPLKDQKPPFVTGP